MKYALTGLAAAAALAAIALTPATADAGWRGGYWGGGWGPGFGVYVGPRPYYRNYGYGYRNYGYRNYGYVRPYRNDRYYSQDRIYRGGDRSGGRPTCARA